MAMKFSNQILQADRIKRIVPPFHFGIEGLYAYRYMSGDDHELAGSIAISKFLFQPGPTGLV